jgi:hypothetical protein
MACCSSVQCTVFSRVLHPEPDQNYKAIQMYLSEKVFRVLHFAWRRINQFNLLSGICLANHCSSCSNNSRQHTTDSRSPGRQSNLKSVIARQKYMCNAMDGAFVVLTAVQKIMRELSSAIIPKSVINLAKILVKVLDISAHKCLWKSQNSMPTALRVRATRFEKSYRYLRADVTLFSESHLKLWEFSSWRARRAQIRNCRRS